MFGRPRSANPRVDLLREDVYDRRWSRHRDQILTALAIAGTVVAAVGGPPSLIGLAALPAGPRAAQWLRRSSSGEQTPAP